MKKLIFSEAEYKDLKGLINSFNDIYGDDETPFELEDYIDLVSLGRSIIEKLEKANIKQQ